MARLLKIMIEAANIEEEHVTGSARAEGPCACYIDLDKVSVAWLDPDGNTNITIDGDTLVTKSYTLERFISEWSPTPANRTRQILAQGIDAIAKKDVPVAGTVEPCEICGSRNITQTGTTQTCGDCHFSWSVL